MAGVPFFPQDYRQCGPASLAALLSWSGVETTPQDLEPWLYIPEKGGSLQPEMLAAARRSGRVPYVIPATPEAMLAELEAGHPVLILQNNGISWYPAWHYAVVIGSDSDTITLRSGDYETLRTDAAVFMRTWQRADYWAMVALPEDRLPVTASAATVVRALEAYGRVQGEIGTRAGLEKAFVRWPNDPEVALALGNLHYGAGEAEQAISVWQSGLAGGESAALRNNLAWVLAEEGRVAEAQAILEPALAAPAGFGAQVQATAAFLECLEQGGSLSTCQ